MNTKKIKRVPVLAGLALAALLAGCGTDDSLPQPAQPQSNYEGLFLVNEGDYGQANGSIGFYNLSDSVNPIFDNDIFRTVNNIPLGDIVQSLTFYNNHGYIAVNNSQKLEVVNAATFASVATVPVGSPRYFAVITPNNGYVTDW